MKIGIGRLLQVEQLQRTHQELEHFLLFAAFLQHFVQDLIHFHGEEIHGDLHIIECIQQCIFFAN